LSDDDILEPVQLRLVFHVSALYDVLQQRRREKETEETRHHQEVKRKQKAVYS
jgi:hypothetical protein